MALLAACAQTPTVYRTQTGKTILISETHPVGQSLSTIKISTQGFEHEFNEVYVDRDPIEAVLLADLDRNGFDEIYIILRSAGSGSYGSLLGLASNRDQSLSLIHLPAPDVDSGYMGHDTFQIEGQQLVRSFPVYKPGDSNLKPSGGTRKLVYELVPGEAMWQLKLTAQLSD